MRLLVHLLRADVRRFRWVLAAWCTLAVAQTVVAGVQPGTIDDVRVYESVGLLGSLLWVATSVGTIFLVAAVVQAHPAVGSDAFWMTRPIPRPALWASKIVLLGLVTVIVPSIAETALMATNHVPATDAIGVAIDTLLRRSVWLGILLVPAAVTSTLARFALVIGGTVVAVTMTMAITISRLRFATPAPPRVASGLPPAPDPTALLVFEVGVLAASLLLVWLQYRTRRRRAAVPAGVAALALTVVLAGHWPLPVLRPPSSIPAWAHDAAALQLRVRSPRIVFDRVSGWGGGEEVWRTGRGEVEMQGVAPGWQSSVMLLDGSAMLPGGRTIDGRGHAYRVSLSLVGSREFPSRTVARQVLGVDRVWMPDPPMGETAILMDVPGTSIEGADGLTAAYHGRFGVYLRRWETLGTLPLRSGATFQQRSYRFRIDSIATLPNVLLIRARESRATSSFDRRPRENFMFYMRNRARSEALAASVSDPTEGGMPLPGVFGFHADGQFDGFQARGVQVAFPPTWGLQGEVVRLDRDWFAGAELVILRSTDAGAVERTLDMPEVTLVAK